MREFAEQRKRQPDQKYRPDHIGHYRVSGAPHVVGIVGISGLH